MSESSAADEATSNGYDGAGPPTDLGVLDGLSVEDAGDGVLVVWLDRPERGNAFTQAMQLDFHRALAALDARDEVRVIVVAGRGRHFCTGADLGPGQSTFDLSPEETDALRRTVSERARPWVLRTPVIGALHGAAVGLGLTLALQWDVRVMAAEAKYSFVFTRRGLTPEAASAWLLPRLVGTARATELLLGGRTFDGVEAAAIGLATVAVAGDQVLSTALTLAREWAVQCSPLALAATKQLLAESWETPDVEAAWSRDWELFRWIGRQPDVREGVQAFLDKRVPQWPPSKHTVLPIAPSVPWEAP